MFSLLPEKYRKKLHVEYKIRLIVICLSGLFILTIISGVFIFPTYLRVTTENNIFLAQKQALEKEIALQTGLSSTDDVKSIKQDINVAVLDQRSVILVINAVVQAKSADIKLTNFSYTYNLKASTLAIEGIASSRQSLQSFYKKLLAQKLFNSVNLPLSDYAKDSNIPFSMTLTGNF